MSTTFHPKERTISDTTASQVEILARIVVHDDDEMRAALNAAQVASEAFDAELRPVVAAIQALRARDETINLITVHDALCATPEGRDAWTAFDAQVSTRLPNSEPTAALVGRVAAAGLMRHASKASERLAAYIASPHATPAGIATHAADLAADLTAYTAVADDMEAAGADDMEAAGATLRPLGVLLSEVEPEAVQWLWPGYIPLGKVTALDGDPGLGKSTITTQWAACVTQGLPWPDGSCCAPGGVVLLSAEDDDADTIRPRLDAAGADVSKVYHLTGVSGCDDEGKPTERDVYLPGDLPVLEAAIKTMEARLVIIDPLMAFLSGDVNSHRDQDVRGALRPMAALASRTGAAIVLVRHLNKATIANAMYRGGGSIGIIGAARSGLIVAPDPDDPASGTPNGRRVLAVLKINVAAGAPALTYRVVGATNGVGVIEWGGASSRTANELMAQANSDEERTERTDAAEFLREALAQGERRSSDVQKEATALGISSRTLTRARKAVGVQSRREGGVAGAGEWFLSLPKDAIEIAKNAKNAINMTRGALRNRLESYAAGLERAARERDAQVMRRSMSRVMPA